ncbi:leukotriene A-4 hydrolase isoform X2 [Anoplophora glabripennis]|uniref:leukotriene A-4 hydrolase isoform X2 n=1 Tax=Anoplophora glabripennis TaxID=217634 RepID=UPI0008751016|nr:leukotriene A-4 hydrolase isoform X2 [Anoplophora glabripennis]
MVLNQKNILFCVCVGIFASLFKGRNCSTMEKTGLSPLDPSSFSRPELAVVTEIFLNLSVNFDKKILIGNVDLSVKKIDENVNEIVLDSSKLNIASIYDAETNDKLEYNLSEAIAEYGSKLSVQLPKKDSNSYKIGIKYETSPDATGLQWLSPNATAGKKHPYLFSQFQPTHARSVLPCQDTPAVKTKYTATISAPQEYTVLMSAICNGSKELHGGKLSHFVQTVPMPSYLIAIAVGVLQSRKIGPRSHVWAEKEIIEDCAFEFAETEHQLKTAEEICGPYVWGIYDLLVLPPSFPYGGMENPCLTFVTPTLLAGDRSLANVVAHEIAHSWTGNLITNRNFEHFWLNEGFTVFVERKIKGRLESPQSQDFDAYTHVTELNETVNRIGKDSPLTQLVVNLKGVHPDDAFSIIPYEKGQTFLRYLENVVGGPENFEPFLRKYFDTFKYKSIETKDFQDFFNNYFNSNPDITLIDWKTWLYSPGMPPVIPDYDKSLAVICDNLIEKFLKWDGEGEIPLTIDDKKNLTTNQIIYFLQIISEAEAQPIKKLEMLNNVFGFNDIKNSEIKFRWLRVCIKARWEEKVHVALTWINIVGRMKFVRPLYRDLYQWEEIKQRTVDNFLANRHSMMHVSAYTLEKDLHVDA